MTPEAFHLARTNLARTNLSQCLARTNAVPTQYQPPATPPDEMEPRKLFATLAGEEDDPWVAVYWPAVSETDVVLANFRLVSKSECVHKRTREEAADADLLHVYPGTPVVLSSGAAGYVVHIVGDAAEVELEDGTWVDAPLAEIHYRMTGDSAHTVDDLAHLVEDAGSRVAAEGVRRALEVDPCSRSWVGDLAAVVELRRDAAAKANDRDRVAGLEALEALGPPEAPRRVRVDLRRARPVVGEDEAVVRRRRQVLEAAVRVAREDEDQGRLVGEQRAVLRKDRRHTTLALGF